MLTSSPPCSFINNEFVKGVDGKTFETINPSNEKPIVAVHEATEKDVDIAVATARKVFEGEYRKVTPDQRARWLVKLADLMERDLETLAAIESLDNGKAFSMAKVDVSMAAGCLRYYGGWADKVEGKVIETNPETFNYTRQEPVSSLSPAVFMTHGSLCVRSVFAPKSSRGTSLYSCGPGKLAQLLRLAML